MSSIPETNRPCLRRLLISAVILSGFLPFYLLLEGDDLFTMLDALAVSLGSGVVISYAPAFFRWLIWKGRTTAGFLLALGILITWIALDVRLSWLWAWRLSGKPDEVFDHWIVAATIYLAIIGASLHLLAQSSIKDQDHIPMHGWLILGSAILIGFAIGGFLIWWI